MAFSVQERAECVGTYRWIEIQLMEMLAQWVPTTPEMEVKVLFGRHVWDCAQHADALGKRAFELRAPLNFTLPAVEGYRAFLNDVAGLGPTPDRISAFYGIICPGVMGRYRDYLGDTDRLMDEPTVRILERALQDYERMFADRDRLAGEFTRRESAFDVVKWSAREQAFGDPVLHGEEHKRARGARA